MLNASIFYMDISDMQVEEAIDPYQSWITNAAEATSKGVELEITARVTDGLSLMGGFGYTDIEFDKFSYAKNLFDEEYDSAGYYGGSYVVYSDPGEVGLYKLAYRF